MESEAEFLRAVAPIIATNNISAARAFVDLTPPPPDISMHGPKMLRAWGDLMYTAEQDKGALYFFSALQDKDPTSHWPYFQIGRLKARSRDFADALDQFSQCVVRAPEFAWGWYELLRNALELKDIDNVARAAAGFCSARQQKLGPPQARVLEAAAHFLFERKRREDALPIYTILVDQNLADDLVYVRQAEYFLSRQDSETAIKLLEPLHQTRSLDHWGMRVLAQAYREEEQFAQARELLAEIVRRKPENYQFLVEYIRLLAQQGLREAAEAALRDARAHHSVHDCAGLQATLASETGDYAGLLELLQGDPNFGGTDFQSTIDRAIVGCAYKAKDHDTALRLIAWRLARFGEAKQVALCAINIGFASRNWPLVREWLLKFTPNDFAENLDLRVKRFEYHCFSGEFALAEKSLEALQPIRELPTRFILPVLKYYAEISDWPLVYRAAMDNLDHNFEFAAMGSLIVRAARKTSSHARAILRIEELLAEADSASLRGLRAILAEDIADDAAKISALLDDTKLETSGIVRQRLFLKRSVLSTERTQRSRRLAIYYCTNRAYLGPSFVSLVSLVNSNRDVLEDADLFIVVDDPDTCSFAQKIAKKLSTALRIPPIRIVSSGEIDMPASSLKTSYGLFTAGHSLAEAAYYRIYFARHLQREGLYESALYIDSDTIVHGDLNPLFAVPASPALRARLDAARPEVEAAIRQHGLEPGRYFNSGVLAFNLRHDDLASALDRCADAIVNRQDTLIFQDQCALNIGFQGLFGELDPNYNFFIDPGNVDQMPGGAILHFLDRPKPWDSLYAGKLGRIWFLNWHCLAVHIGSEDALALYTAANER